ncbi:hypothetical protein C9374_008184 [Naegleria lovaniensis]|uniref:Cell division cycle protein 123 n=1 Tax=Naegleria lovaniensis TaxID=51637 RepID=A0AA88GKR9_NAELO|nr:uncharacterized protein C9374_008184 [Naegleria lovaniensis]KAG2378545.1 hypothetical protein C9374_008184 [Naegleria lovaniensis]
MSCLYSSARERYGFDFDIDQWYQKCSEFTPFTKFIFISKEQASVLKRQHEHQVLKQEVAQISQEEYELLKILEKEIDDVLQNEKEFFDEENDISCAFIRLNTRSPKDAAFSSQKIKQILKRKLYEKSMQYREPALLSNDEKQNDEFISFFESQVEVMRFESGAEALEMMVASNRVYEDLSIALEHRTDPSDWNVFIAMRKWIPGHEIGLEFRGFVFERKLCALSQYFDALYFEDLHNHKDIYLKAIQQFFEERKHQLPYENCVLDVMVMRNKESTSDAEEEAPPSAPTLENLTVQVLEFNPFNKFTGSALFSWITDADTLHGRKPFEFRIREAPLPALRSGLQEKASDHENGDLTSQQTIMFNLFNVQDDSILQEHGDLIAMVDDFMNNDLERINANLRYVLQKTTKESALERLALSE